MKNKKFIGILILLTGFWLTAACSKKLMPPEIESSGAVSESGTSVALADEKSSAFSGGSDDGFFSEQDLTEMGTPTGPAITSRGPGGSMRADNGFGAPGGFGSTGREFGSGSGGMPGSGSSGSYSSDPFSGAAEMGAMGGNGGMGGNGRGGVEEARMLSYRSSTDLQDIHFEFDKYDLDERSKKILRENAEYLKNNPNARIEIQGHCDERGTNNYNIALGERRAHSTKKFLMAIGVPEDRMHTISYGEEKPFCFDSNENCWWKNRRAHFMVSE